MTKVLRMKFTGNAVLTPDYPDGLEPINGPLYAVMPGARRRRNSPFVGQQIDAQFAFVMFPYQQLIVKASNDRDADYKYPDVATARTGICFLEREDLAVEATPAENQLTFQAGDTSGFPTIGATETKWIARWRDFASGGRAALKPTVLTSPGDYVRVRMPAGHVTAGFVAEPIARLDFDYGLAPVPRPYAQEIVVTMTFADTVPSVTLSCQPFPGSGGQPTFLTFGWFGSPSIDLLFGNGSLASIQSVLTTPIAGHDHQGDYDVEFDVLYDAVNCLPDNAGRLPLPHLKSFEILRVPCIASMIDQSNAGFADSAVTGEYQRAEPEWQARTLPTQRRQRREP